LLTLLPVELILDNILVKKAGSFCQYTEDMTKGLRILIKYDTIFWQKAN